MTASDVVTIISALSVALVAIIGAWRTVEKVKVLTDNTERSANVAGKKLDAIHELTNSNLTAVKTDLTLANNRIAKLEGLITELLEKPESIESKDKATKEVAKEVAKRKAK